MLMRLHTTYGEGSWREQFRQTSSFCDDIQGVENEVINIYPEDRFESFEGFGGAITDAAASVYSLMSESQKKEVIETYFSQTEMGYRLARIHMDSCDFSVGTYEALSDKDDEALAGFSFDRTEKYIIPMLKDAEAAAGGAIELMLSPWSPPAFMKTNQSRLKGGQLLPEYRSRWASYICRYITEFKKRGFTVRRISLQNEPKAVQTWDSCIYSDAEEKEFLRDFMYPALQAHGLRDIEIYIWDHNKERAYERLCAIHDETTASMIAGLAFHWYSGDHFEALDLIRRRFPEKKLIVSESCIEYNKFSASDNQTNAERLSHEIIGDLNHGTQAFYDWNLLLNEEGGPNHAGNFCHAPFLYDTKRKVLMPQLLLQHFSHFSRSIIPGSVRIGFSKYTDRIDITAYKRPDGLLAAVFLNRGDAPLPINVRISGRLASALLYPHSITSALIDRD